MAKTRKKIAEQILRMVSGGNVSDDSSIDIREVMALVDQERDSLIKTEIMGTGDFEVRGELLSKERLYTEDNSYVSLNNIPIVLPNDMGIFKVESVPPKELSRGKRTLTITNGVAASNKTKEKRDFEFEEGPRKLDNQYMVSFTINIADTTGGGVWRESAATHKFSFNIKMPKGKVYRDGQPMDLSRFHTINFVEAVVNDKKLREELQSIYMAIGITDLGADKQAALVFEAAYDFTVTDLKINGEGSDGSHLFKWDDEKQISAFAGESDTEEDSLTVMISGHKFGVHYGEWKSRTIYPTDIARHFVDLHANDIALKTGVSVTRGDSATYGAGTVLTFEEIIPNGGRNLQHISISTYGDDISVSLQTTSNYEVETDETAFFYNPISFTRMPSGGHTSSLYHETIIKSGRRFFYIEGNKVYLYKNYDRVDALDVWYIASSSSISNDEVYPVSADFEKQIITNLVQMFTVMKQAKEDLVNDNIG